uniref:KH domain-containing protein At2g38610 n=1 Tax=Anthurium amnicola TaxID=1678845 RepID=A0A1D1ZGS2_9ARAE
MHAEEEEGGRRRKMIEGHKKCREMMGKGEVDGSRTVDSLRGRLLAERVASRAAREEAEVMSKRLMELERLLAIEIKARNKAERRLKRMLKKLDSLKIFDVSSQSHVSDGSGSSSSVSSSGVRMVEGEQEAKPPSSQNEESARRYVDGKMGQTLDLSSSEDIRDDDSSAVSPGSVNQSVSQEESWTGHSHDSKNPSGEETSDFQHSPDSLCKGQSEDDDTRGRVIDEKEPDKAQHQIEDVDDRLALVPTRIWNDSEVTNEPQKNINVQGVLIALKHVKMQLQSTMERGVTLSP